VGIAGEALLVGFAILAPMLWPQVLPRTTLITSLLPPVPPGRPKPDVDRPRATPTRTRPILPFRTGALVTPTTYPPQALILEDPPPETSGIYVPGSTETGQTGGAGDGLLGRILGGDGPPLPHPRVAEVARAPVVAAPALEPKRYKLGGLVKSATLIRRVEPQYPVLAKTARVQGVVELVGVISTDGHLKEVRLVSGHPLLARAAIDAVSQWLYLPTTLNGEPVEVIAPITVTFRLN
jgi:protein TonB